MQALAADKACGQGPLFSAAGLESRSTASQQQHVCECRTPASRLRDARRKADSGDLRQIGGSLKTTLVSYASNMPYVATLLNTRRSVHPAATDSAALVQHQSKATLDSSVAAFRVSVTLDGQHRGAWPETALHMASHY